MTLLGSTENETTKDKNCGNVLSLQNDEVVLIHWNIVNSDYQYDSTRSFAPQCLRDI